MDLIGLDCTDQSSILSVGLVSVVDSIITTFNAAVTETASEILGKHRQKKKKNLGYCRNSRSVRQKERTEKEKV